MNQEERKLYLIGRLLDEMPQYRDITVPEDSEGRWRLLRSLFNVRPAGIPDEDFLSVQDAFLQEMTAEKGITEATELTPAEGERIFLWQGDITTLRADAVVNAANSALLGCWQPLHGCIDNILHTMSGVQLRAACAEIMAAQGHEEPIGCAKITPGFNLPASYVIHTVGPAPMGILRKTHYEQLASCYRSCMEAAEKQGCKSLAFCCISTGVFGFPQKEAAETAVRTVREYLPGSTLRQIIFNVFTDADLRIYRRILTGAAEVPRTEVL